MTLAVASYLLVPAVVAGSDLVATLPGRLFEGLADRLALSAPPAFWHERTDGDAANVWLRSRLVAGGTSSTD